MLREDFEKWFEELAELAKTDPEGFEAKRVALIEEAISSASQENQERLRRFQWRIDMERQRAKTPLAACLRLHDMLMEMVYGEGGFLEAVNTLKGILEGLESQSQERINQALAENPLKKKEDAVVIPFPKRS